MFIYGFFERKEGRRGRNINNIIEKTWTSRPPYTSQPEMNPQPRYVPWPELTLQSFWFKKWDSNQLSHPAGASLQHFSSVHTKNIYFAYFLPHSITSLRARKFCTHCILANETVPTKWCSKNIYQINAKTI